MSEFLLKHFLQVGPSPGHSEQSFKATTIRTTKRFFRFAIAFTRQMTSLTLDFSYLDNSAIFKSLRNVINTCPLYEMGVAVTRRIYPSFSKLISTNWTWHHIRGPIWPRPLQFHTKHIDHFSIFCNFSMLHFLFFLAESQWNAWYKNLLLKMNGSWDSHLLKKSTFNCKTYQIRV